LPALLLTSLLLAAGPDAPSKTPVRSDEMATYEFVLRAAPPGADRAPFTLFLTPREDRGYATAQADYLMDCPGRTATMQAVRTYDAAGAQTRSVEAPLDRQRAEPVYSGDAIGDVYALVCPNAPPLPAPPPPGPPPIAATPRP
jgi:hypothetical protein